MTFTSNIFLIGFLPWFLFLYSLFKDRVNGRKIMVFLANSIFYIWGGVETFVVVCVISLVTWFFCRICSAKKSRLVGVIGCTLIIIPLLLTKYTSFVIVNINRAFKYGIEVPSLIVPIGISFFTFEAISCLCDVYKGKVKERLSIVDIYLYLTFFPTVTSGPIVRISDFIQGYETKITISSYSSGIEKIAIGLCKKVLIADKIAILANYYFDGVALGNTYSCIGLWCGSIAYSLQLYFDFSGYSDMAIGMAEVMGYNIPRNFDSPYQARSIQDFWKKWHISLSTWFRDYIYIPLGGNRCSTRDRIRNLLVVWLLTGVWHGADWTFIIWGMGYFCLLLGEKYVPFMRTIGKYKFGHVYTLFLVNLLWIPFRASNLLVAKNYIMGMYNFSTLRKIEENVVRFFPFLIFSCALCLPWNKWLSKYMKIRWVEFLKRGVLLIFVGIAICAVVNAAYTPYIYGNF